MLAQLGSPDGVDTRCDRMKTAASNAMKDGLGRVSELEQLRPRDDPMLSGGKVPDP
jgi:hypothetical protein